MKAYGGWFIAYSLLIASFPYITLGQLFGNTTDFLEQGFAPSKAQNTVVNIGNDKRSVGNQVFREGVAIDMEDRLGQSCFVNQAAVQQFNSLFCDQVLEGDWDGIACKNTNGSSDDESRRRAFCENEIGGDWDTQAFQVTQQPPLIVRITKFLLRMTIVLSITMIIYNGIRYVAAAGSEEGTKKARDSLLYVVGGLLLALLSLAIVTLIESLTFGTLPGVTG